MNEKKKYGVILFVIIIFSIYDHGGAGFTDGLYSPIVFYFCYLFLSMFELRKINYMNLHRYKSMKYLYISYMKRQLEFVMIYTLTFSAICYMSLIIGTVVGGAIQISVGAIIKFMFCNYVNLLLLVYLQLILYMKFRLWTALILPPLCVFISLINMISRVYISNPFVFHTAYMRKYNILNIRTGVSYIMCIVICVVVTHISFQGDRTLS